MEATNPNTERNIFAVQLLLLVSECTLSVEFRERIVQVTSV